MTRQVSEPEARAIELRKEVEGGKFKHTTARITERINREFNTNFKKGTIEYWLRLWREGLSERGQRYWMAYEKDIGSQPMPPDGTRVQCLSCGASAWTPEVPSKCPSCRTRLASGTRLTKNCRQFDRERVWG